MATGDQDDVRITKRLIAMHISVILKLIEDAKFSKRDAEEIADQLMEARDDIYKMY